MGTVGLGTMFRVGDRGIGIQRRDRAESYTAIERREVAGAGTERPKLLVLGAAWKRREIVLGRFAPHD